MMKQCIPEELLQNCNKILFITHCSLSDYIYLQTYFKAFAEQYPQIKIDVWIDEIRRTRCWWRWKYLKRYALYDWLAAALFFNKIYRETYSSGGYKRCVKRAQQEQYPLVVSLATLRVHKYVALARKISSTGFVVSFQQNPTWFEWRKKMLFKKSNATIQERLPDDQADGKVTNRFAWWFEQLFKVQVEPARRVPSVAIPMPWLIATKLKFMKHGIDKKQKPFGKVYFINAYAQTKHGSWPLENVIDLIRVLKQDDIFNDVTFLIHVIPEEYNNIHARLSKQWLNNVIVFCARDNFFQLPATLSLCDLIISVETEVVHLACAVTVPVVALMRQENAVKDISVDAVVKKVKEVVRSKKKSCPSPSLPDTLREHF